jgi:hypothetical protein
LIQNAQITMEHNVLRVKSSDVFKYGQDFQIEVTYDVFKCELDFHVEVM